MNLWECDVPGCTSTAVGAGGAIGLLAIGWSVEPGVLLCPKHRPDPIPCTSSIHVGEPCSGCRADVVANTVQHAIAQHYDQLIAWDAERRLAGKPVIPR